MKKGFKLLLLLLVALGSSSCFKRDKMENINVYATVYPIEFIISKLYNLLIHKNKARHMPSLFLYYIRN